MGELSDVDVTGVTDGQVLAYDASVQEWQPADDAGGVTELGQLTDVQFGQGGPETGELLKYDGSEWTNDSLVKSEVGLGNVDNTSDADKPVSTATQTALSAKANSADFSNVDNTSDADKPVSTATQTALDAKADTSAVPTDLNDLSDVTIVGTPVGNQALIYDATAGAFKSQVSYTNRFEDEVETGLQMPSVSFERGYSVKSEGDGIFIDPSPDTPTAGKVIVRKIYHKTGFISDADVIGDYTLIHTFADDTAYADTVATFDGFEDGATYGVPPFTLAQTWEEVTAAPAFTGLLNETYGSGAEAAYSTRRLNGNVTECMVIRRASDSTTTTIGFDGSGNIDEAAIETFCTGTTCTLYQWLDQSGNGNTATASAPANEPTIYTGGALVKRKGRIALDFLGNDNIPLPTNSLPSNINNASSFLVYDFDTAAPLNVSYLALALGRNSPNQRWYTPFIYNSTGLEYFSYGNSLSGNVIKKPDDFVHLLTAIAGSTQGNASAFADGTIITTTSLQSAVPPEGAIGGFANSNNHYKGTMQEIVIYDSDKSSVRTDIEENIGDYFTQNTPLLDTYTGAAAAYSLRKLRTAYTGDAVEVYNGSSYANIGFNVFSELDTVALAAHCGSNDGFVSKWYDQSGNTNTAAQTNTANMPKIYDGTTGVNLVNGKPATVQAANALLESPALSLNSSVSLSFVASVNTNSFILSGQSANQEMLIAQSGSSLTQIDSQVGTPSYYLNGTSKTFADRADVYTSFSSQKLLYADADFSAWTEINLGYAFSSSLFPMASMSEFVIWNSDQSSNRTGIETNINTFYNIYS